ncbi:MAG: tetraacyldisaccharide 4'-kinase [Defluviicoccus sp.]|nr:tetraacyldisaccharide 4'-kinase [Defluviicoccus sp.]MDE0384328.1 tetraacyldisaccharide 4'-kinase [Defluviicoccus sp.]
MRTPEFWRRDGLAARALAPASWLYGAVAAVRHRTARPVQPPVPVLCVGNLVAGGAGKTPVALALGAKLAARGHAVHFLSRGYGGRERGPLLVDPARHGADAVGDEPLLLARVAPTWVSADRAAGATAAAEGGAGLIVMDDGHQNATVAKACSIVVVDGVYGFGNGRLLPAGPLRETVAAGLARADAVVAVGPDEAGIGAAIPTGVRASAGRLAPPPDGAGIADRKVVAFAGIARPEKFFATLRTLGCRIEHTRAFADHHRYREAEIAVLLQIAASRGAVAVTTAKDAVRLPPALRGAVRVLDIVFEWNDAAAEEALIAEIEKRTAIASEAG